jgi:hypothetical protein
MRYTVRDFLDPLLPPILFHNHPRFKELTGYSPGTMRNLNARGEGPAERVIVGRVTGYPKDALLDWLERRSRPVKRGAE